MRPAICWFRRDLRLTDNPALSAAAHQGRPVVAVYIHSPEEAGRWAEGAAGRWWLHHSLQALAAFLRADPARRVTLVGHTDTVGALDRNIALSKRRAASVLERLVSAHGVPRAQIAAEGMGYLAPIASNLTPEGREANRRVEVVLLNTE